MSPPYTNLYVGLRSANDPTPTNQNGDMQFMQLENAIR